MVVGGGVDMSCGGRSGHVMWGRGGQYNYVWFVCICKSSLVLLFTLQSFHQCYMCVKYIIYGARPHKSPK